jgi:hypothetical protein
MRLGKAPAANLRRGTLTTSRSSGFVLGISPLGVSRRRHENVDVPSRRSATLRWWVHLGLMVSVVVSLCFEFVLTVHIVVGLLFVVLVGCHLVQRRRISTKLLRRLTQFTTSQPKLGRMAVSDAMLAVLTIGMLVSGFVDVALGHPTQIRWHALLGVALSVYLVVHTLRRRKRLKSSAIR